MRSLKITALACGVALITTACASAPPTLVPTKHVNKRDMDACTKVAESKTNDPARKAQQAATAGTAFAVAGLSGMMLTAAAQGVQDTGIETAARDACLAKKGYKLVPAKS